MTGGGVAPGATRIGWIGLGVMGASMCGHLQRAGYATTVSTRTRARAGDQVRLLLDGLPHGTSRGLEFTLSNVDRGTHTLAVEVIDSSGAVLLTGAPSTFHLLRYSALSTGPQPVPQGG
jgi:hypothetical protein